MFKLDLEKAEEPEIKLPASIGSLEKQENSRKKIYTAALLIMPKALTVWITTNCGKFFKRWPDHLTSLPRNLHAGQKAAVRTRYGTTAWFQIRK